MKTTITKASICNQFTYPLLKLTLLREPNNFFSSWASENSVFPACRWQMWRSLFPLGCVVTPLTDLSLREPGFLVEYQWTEGEKTCKSFSACAMRICSPIVFSPPKWKWTRKRKPEKWREMMIRSLSWVDYLQGIIKFTLENFTIHSFHLGKSLCSLEQLVYGFFEGCFPPTAWRSTGLV